MDKEMYDHMSINTDSLIVDRGLQLHKMIRLLTFGLGGEAYLNLMGNEFGHPEWIDVPREGNGHSYHHCRRRFDLPEEENLKYKFFREFDKAMLQLEKEVQFMNSGDSGYIVLKHQEDKLIIFERGKMLFVFNFHPTQDFHNYYVGIEYPGVYKIRLSTDDPMFGGWNRVSPVSEFFTEDYNWQNRRCRVQIGIPHQCAFVLKFDR
jgi:1,4-alpha-glucan branching enzyme